MNPYLKEFIINYTVLMNSSSNLEALERDTRIFLSDCYSRAWADRALLCCDIRLLSELSCTSVEKEAIRQHQIADDLRKMGNLKELNNVSASLTLFCDSLDIIDRSKKNGIISAQKAQEIYVHACRMIVTLKDFADNEYGIIKDKVSGIIGFMNLLSNVVQKVLPPAEPQEFEKMVENTDTISIPHVLVTCTGGIVQMEYDEIYKLDEDLISTLHKISGIFSSIPRTSEIMHHIVAADHLQQRQSEQFQSLREKCGVLLSLRDFDFGKSDLQRALDEFLNTCKKSNQSRSSSLVCKYDNEIRQMLSFTLEKRREYLRNLLVQTVAFGINLDECVRKRWRHLNMTPNIKSQNPTPRRKWHRTNKLGDPVRMHTGCGYALY